MLCALEPRSLREIVDEDGDTVVKLSEVEVLRISGVDVILSMGGEVRLFLFERQAGGTRRTVHADRFARVRRYSQEQLSPLVVECMNETLNEFGFKLSDNAAQGEWFVSDGKIRLIRFFDGCVIEGAAAQEAEAAADEWAGAKGGKGAAQAWAAGKGWGGGKGRGGGKGEWGWGGYGVVPKAKGKGASRFAPY